MSMTCFLTLMTGDKSKSCINKCFENAEVVISVSQIGLQSTISIICVH